MSREHLAEMAFLRFGNLHAVRSLYGFDWPLFAELICISIRSNSRHFTSTRYKRYLSSQMCVCAIALDAYVCLGWSKPIQSIWHRQSIRSKSFLKTIASINALCNSPGHRDRPIYTFVWWLHKAVNHFHREFNLVVNARRLFCLVCVVHITIPPKLQCVQKAIINGSLSIW